MLLYPDFRLLLARKASANAFSCRSPRIDTPARGIHPLVKLFADFHKPPSRCLIKRSISWGATRMHRMLMQMVRSFP